MSSQPHETGLISEPTIVVGVVHPMGTRGAEAGEKLLLTFALETWRSEDGNLHSGKLIIRREVTREEWVWLLQRIKRYAIITVRVVFTAPAEAELIELLDQVANTDDALAQRVTELLNKTFEHELIGIVRYDRQLDMYTATPSWSGKEIMLYLMGHEDSEIEAALQVAVALWKDQSNWNQRIQDFAVQSLLNGWLEEGEEPLTPDEFKSLMTLEGMWVFPAGHFDFWHDDGYMFAAHAIRVSGSLSEGLTYAGLG